MSNIKSAGVTNYESSKIWLWNTRKKQFLTCYTSERIESKISNFRIIIPAECVPSLMALVQSWSDYRWRKSLSDPFRVWIRTGRFWAFKEIGEVVKSHGAFGNRNFWKFVPRVLFNGARTASVGGNSNIFKE